MTGAPHLRLVPSPLPADGLTRVELTWIEKKVEYWIRFGKEKDEQILDRHRRVLAFTPNSVFAFVRWASNDHGTILSRIDIVRAITPGERYQTLPFVRPGGDILLKMEGWPKVERVLQIVDAIEAIGIDPAEVSPHHWRHVHHRLTAGEEPLYLLRRMVRMAVEDIGLADSNALTQCLAAKDAYDFLGSPEGELAIAQAVIYVATAPKSNAAYKAFGAAKRVAKEGGSLLPPKHILNAPTKLMQGEGYGAGYQYDHDAPDAFSGQDYFPEALGRQHFYDPPERGFEREIRKRLDYWAKLRKERGG